MRRSKSSRMMGTEKSVNECDICLRPNQKIYLTQTQGGGVKQNVCDICMSKFKEMYLKPGMKKSGRIPYMIQCPLTQRPITIPALAANQETMFLLPCCRIFASKPPKIICHLCERILCYQCTKNCSLCLNPTCPHCFRYIFPNYKCKGCYFQLPTPLHVPNQGESNPFAPLLENEEDDFVVVIYIYIYIINSQERKIMIYIFLIM